jgi:hypothetical protein
MEPKETVTAADFKILMPRTAPASSPKTAIHTNPNEPVRAKKKSKAKKKFVP